MHKFKFAVVISHPIQHYSPLFRALAQLPELEVKVFYYCDHGVRESFDPGFGRSFKWDIPLLDGYQYEFLRSNYSPPNFGFREVDSPDLARKLDEFKPQAIWVHGYGQGISWRAVRWANRHNAAVMYFGDSELLHARKTVALAAKRLLLPWFFSRCDAFITIGDNNERYYRHYGVPSSKLFRGACPVDIRRFTAARESSTPAERAATRDKLGLPQDAFVVTQAGKLEPWKRPLDLVEAVARLRDLSPPVHALFVGDGPLRSAVEQRVSELGLQDRVVITGFVNQLDMPKTLVAADALAVTSDRDAHPLAVTESLALGHPVIASDRVGCVGPTDTARPGYNALVYSTGSVQQLADCIQQLAIDPALYQSMAQASLELAPSQDVSAAVQTVLQALHTLAEGPFRKYWPQQLQISK